MLLALILCLYFASINALENEPSNSKPISEETWSTECPNTAILMKAINIMSNTLPHNPSTILEPDKLRYALSTVMTLLEKESLKDKLKLHNHLTNLDYQLDKIIKKNKETILRAEEDNSKAKDLFQYEIPITNKCQHIFGLLVNFINNAYMQVANYCKLTGNCYANGLYPLKFNFNDQHNILSQNSDATNGFKYFMNSDSSTINKKENNAIKISNNVKEDYDILRILQNYKLNSDINQAKGTQKSYHEESQQGFNQDKYKTNQIINSIVDDNNQEKTLNSKIFQQQPPKTTSDGLSLKDILSKINSLSRPNDQNSAKSLSDITNKNYIATQIYERNYMNRDNEKDFLPIYKNLLKSNSNVANTKSVTDITKLIQPLSPEQLLYNRNLPTNAFETILKKISMTPTNTVSNQLLRNPVNLDNTYTQQDYVPSYFYQGSQQDTQELTNLNHRLELMNKIPLEYIVSSNQETSPHPYQSYKESLHQGSGFQGFDQDQFKLTVPGSLTSQHNNYVNSHGINTLVANNKKHENYDKQLPDSSQPLSVSNLLKLNSEPRNYGDVELTYILKRSQPVYEPLYYVKYRMPFKDFLYSMNKVLIQKPYLRSKPNKLYQELLSGSNVMQKSENLKDLKDEDLSKLISTNGTLITAKLLDDSNAIENDQLEKIQNLNANLSVANLLNLNTNSYQSLDPIQDLLNTSVTMDGDSVKNYLDARSKFFNGYINLDNNMPVGYQRSGINDYNPYNTVVGPANLEFYKIPSITYNSLPNSIFEKLLVATPPSYFNAYSQYSQLEG